MIHRTPPEKPDTKKTPQVAPEGAGQQYEEPDIEELGGAAVDFWCD